MRLKDIPNATPEQMVQNLLDTLTSLREGHFTARMTEGFPGIHGQIAQVLNAHMEMLCTFRSEHRRLMEEVGVSGRLGGQMEVNGAVGAWQEMVEDVNRLGANVTNQFRDGANVVADALAGDLAARMTARSIAGEFAAFREQLNQLVQRLEQRSTADATA